MTAPSAFISPTPSIEDCWRGVILYGRNSATYKFALAAALLELSPRAGQLLKMEDIALPYGVLVAEHLSDSPKQCTNPSSKFLSACAIFNQNRDRQALLEASLVHGFQNVIDAFHIVGADPVLHRFFIDERRTSKGLRITDEFEKLSGGIQSSNIAQEVDSRWRLVETAWNLGLPANQLVIQHDHNLCEVFTFDSQKKRKAITGSRAALNGYQKGRCFYCNANIHLLGPDFNTDVDHFFPHKLKQTHLGINFDGVWNLVLSCQACNRGVGGKFDRIPSLQLLERLHSRNEFLIASHHPLRETLINQTGLGAQDRIDFLAKVFREVQFSPYHGWTPVTDAKRP